MTSTNHSWWRVVLAVCVCLCVGVEAKAAITDNLVAHWTFDDNTPGNEYLDSTGTNHGTAQGTVPALSAGPVGPHALELGGAGTINVGSGAGFDTTTYTISAWLEADTTSGWRTAVGSWFGGALWTHLGNNAGTDFGDHGGGQTSGGFVEAGQWNHVVSVRNPGVENQLWVNGVKMAQTSAGAPQIPAANNVYIGTKDGANNGWDGKIDDVGVWGRALSPTEIKEVYEKGLAGVDLASPAPAASTGTLARHSWTSKLAAGDLDGDGAAEAFWVLGNGDIQLYSPTAATGQTFHNAGATAVVAADLTPAGGDSTHELTYLRETGPATAEIRYKSVGTLDDWQHPGAARPNSGLTAGDWNNDGDDGVVVTGTDDAIYGSEDFAWTSPGILGPPASGVGALASFTAGELNIGRAGQEFVGYNTGGTAFYYNGGTSQSYTAIGGGGLSAVTAADVVSSAPGDEALWIANGTQIWQWSATAKWQQLPGGGVGVGAGDLGGTGRDEWMVVGNAPNYNIYRYANNTAWQQVGTTGNWKDFVAADFDGDGADEVFALRQGDGAPYYFDPGVHTDFQPVSVPAAAPGNVVSEYHFGGHMLDSGADGVVADHMTAWNSANVPGATPNYEPGIVGQAIRLGDPTGAQWIGSPDSADADVPATYTIEGFIKPDAVTGGHQRLVLHWEDAYHLGLFGSQLSHYHEQSNGAQPNTQGGTIVPGNWYHVAAVADGSHINIYLDGSLVGSVAYDGTIGNSSNRFFCGSTPSASPYAGLMDELRLHNVAQTQDYLRSRARMLNPNAPNPGKGLVSYHRFQDNGADTAHQYEEHSGQSVDNLTPVGSVSYVDGPFGRAADLNGGYFTVPHSADVQLPSSFTVEAWINPDNPSKTWNRLLLNWGGEMAYHFALRNGMVSLYIKEADGNVFEVAVGGNVVAGEWQHIAAVLDEDTLTGTVFLNGIEVGSGAFDGTIWTTGAEGLGVGDSMGGPDGNHRYFGLIDELAIWDVALTGDQLRTHYLTYAEGYGLTYVPEPATAALLPLAVMALAGYYRRRRGC